MAVDPKVAVGPDKPVELAVSSDEATETIFVLTDQGHIYRQETPHGATASDWVEITGPWNQGREK